VAALVLARRLGAGLQQCLDACRSFRGAARRFEVVGRPGGVVVVDDYAHHPTEVAATVSAARGTAAGRVIAVYVPHTYSRTRTLLADYATSFAGADEVLIGPIEPARERHLEGTVSSADVAEVARASAPARSDAGELAELLRRSHASGMPVFLLGAGSNTLVLDGGIRGLVVRLGDRLRRWHAIDAATVELGGGCMMPRAALDLARRGIAGMEF